MDIKKIFAIANLGSITFAFFCGMFGTEISNQASTVLGLVIIVCSGALSIFQLNNKN